MKKTCFPSRFIVTFVAALCACAGANAANFTTATQQGAGADWNAAIWQSTSPSAGNTYECIAGGNPTRVRNPVAAGVQTFVGDSLQLDVNTEIRAKLNATTINFPGAGGNPGLILNGGNLDMGDNAVMTVSGIILIQAPSSITCGDNAANNTRGWKISSEIRGATNIDVSKYFSGGVNAVELTGVNNPFTGTWIFRSGGFKATGSGSLGNSHIRITPTNGVVNPVVFEAMYDVISTGTLTLTNGGKMTLHQNCTWTAVTIEGTPLTVGTHPFSELAASFPNNFVTGGSGSITVAAPAPPIAPVNVVAVNGDTQVFLSWAPALNAAGYFITRSSTSGGPYTTVGSSGTTNFTDAGLVNGTTNYYVIVATNNLGASTNSAEVVGIPNVVVVGITAVGGTNQVLLNWSALASAASYTVLRATSAGGPFNVIASGLITTTYLDTTAQSGTVYFYRIAAPLTGGGQSGQSATVNATTAPSTPVLNAVRFASTVIRLGWTSPDTANRQFFIERSQDGTNFSFLAVQTNPLSYTNTGLSLSNTYYYRVQASNVTGLSAYSNIASTNTPPSTGYNINFGSAPDASAGGLNSPTPVGYLNDTGGVFGARGNGFNYGWSNNFGLTSTNMGRDTRWRQNPISPDLRYDTLVHLMKANVNSPAQGVIWEIEIPNGPYVVHIVAGDPDNADANADHFQFDVEGVLTPLYVPAATPAIAHWGDFVTSVAVSDGRLTIKSGPLALNNKISFVDIYPDIPVPPIIGVNPVSQTNEQNRAVSLSVTLSQGSPRLDYQWYFNSNLLAGATNQTLTFPHVQLTNQGEYYLVVTNYGGAATSAVATLTVTADTTPPFLVSAGSLSGTTIGVCFNEEIDPVTLGDPFDYSINSGNIGITQVIPRPDGRSAILVLETPVTGSFTVEALGHLDLAGIFSDFSQASGTVLGFTVGDVGTPQFAGSNFTCDGTNIVLVGGGADYWNASDQAYLATKSVTGDFDVRVRVTALAGANTITKAVLLARESISADSAGVHVSVNPTPPGRDLIEMGVRPATAASTLVAGTTFSPAGIPNIWMRLQRSGNTFTGYRSSNGVDWVVLGQSNEVYGTSMLVGLALTAHDNTLLATGTFSNFSLSQSASSDLVVTKTASASSVVRGQHVNYFITVSNLGPDAAASVVLTDAITAGGTFVSASPSQGSISGATTNSFTWNAGTLAANSSATCGVYITTYAVGVFTNSASATSASIDPIPANNSASVAVQVLSPSFPTLIGSSFAGGVFSGSFQTEAELTYEVQYTSTLCLQPPCDPWITLTNIAGDGTLKTFTDPSPAPDRRFYRTLVH